MSDDPNPFVRYGLDPSATLAELTQRLRELAEDATSDEERARLRAAFESLSRSPARRLELVLEAGPAPTSIPSPAPRVEIRSAHEPTLADVLAPAPLAPRLRPETDEERRMRKIDLSFLVRADEAEIAGALPPRSKR